ncbi:MAG: phosphoribosylformylglycinamidine synthase, partial [Kosmotogales bacterium]|nr:phosphoribosylformylglycinamidine synthase [Kosmotogales bacterium]
MKSINTVLVEKKKDFRIEAEHLLEDLKTSLRLKKLEDLRIINRYDVSGLDKESFEMVTNYILSDPVVDDVYRHNYDNKQFDFSFSCEYLPGQFDQRADSAEQCIKILFKNVECKVKFSKIYLFRGSLDESDKKRIKKYLINPVDSREGRKINKTIDSLEEEVEISSEIEIIDGFCNFDREEMETFHKANDMAMSLDDLTLCQEYFLNEKRDPSVTELKVIDTYWSDHCRHTTFSTMLSEIYFSEDNYANEIKLTYDDYLEDHVSYNGNKPVTLMNIATLRSKIELSNDNLKDLIISDEINACTIEIIVDENGKKVPYNLLFKNETHNHPTEIEPFGGAATCLGGAIRDPLSGRAYVYQSMRISGSADPRVNVKDTLPGKLPQRKITREAARGFSSYGNQIGLATGYVKEIYNEGYMAKRLECGMVIGAVPSENVKREKVKKDDLILLIGGKTGRDGCGGATGSSKSHSVKSLEKCGAEVQKGNPLTER